MPTGYDGIADSSAPPPPVSTGSGGGGGFDGEDYDRQMRDLLVLAYISIPLLLTSGGLLAIGAWFKSGFDALTWTLYGLIAAGIWAAAVLAWCAWMVVRDGPQWSSLAPALVLVAAALAAGIWGGGKWLEQHRCERAAAFFTAFATADPAARSALLASGRHHLARPTWCGYDEIQYRLGLDNDGRPVSPAGNEDRLSALRLLLEAGLTPEDRLLFNAAQYGDRDALRLLTEQRRRLNAAGADPAWEVYPVRPAHAALRRLETLDPQDGPEAMERLRGILRDFVNGGTDLCAATESGRNLSELMTRAGLPWQDWQAGGSPAPAPTCGVDPSAQR